MATNTLVTTDLVAKIFTTAFINGQQLLASVDKQLDNGIFEDKGETVRIQRPIMYEATDGAEITVGQESSVQAGTVAVTLEFRKKVVFSLTTQQRTLDVPDLTKLLEPGALELVQKVETEIALAGAQGFYNFSGVPGTTPGDFLAVAKAKAILNKLGVPMGKERNAFFDPDATVELSDGLQTVFPDAIATKAIEAAKIGRYGGFTLFENQSLITHTVGNWGGTPLVNGADQNTEYVTNMNTGIQNLITDGWDPNITGLLKKGDVITINGVKSVNRRSRRANATLAQFVLPADVNSDGGGNAIIPISPPIIIDGAYRTVDVAPANDIGINVITGAANSQHVQNLAFDPNAITVAFAKLVLPEDGTKASRKDFQGMSLRVTNKWNDTSDKNRWRADILFAVKVQNPGFGVRITG